MGDYAPGRKGHSKEYRELNGMDVLPWLAQSPDLNLIEALEAEVKAAWNTISEGRLEGLIRSMPARLRAVLYTSLRWLSQRWKSVK